jgi:cytochrome P450
MARPLQWDLGPWSPWGRVRRVIQDSDRLLLDEIHKRRQAGDAAERRDVLSMLLVARSDEGEGLSDAEVRDELATMVLAGHETTGTALSWALECILRRPDVVRRIRGEIAEAAGGDGIPRSREQLAKLEYLDATIKEVLRLRPIMAFGGTRIVQVPWRLREWEIPPGTAVANALSMVHRRPDLYPDPQEFRPERFLGKRPDPYEWTPFGGGVRRCLGMAFALFEMKIVLARLLGTAELELAEAGPTRAVTRGFFIAPARGLPIRVRPRGGR